MRVNLTDLPPKYQRQAQAQMANNCDRPTVGASVAQTRMNTRIERTSAPEAKCNVNPKAKRTRGQPNKIEAEYNYLCLGSQGVFEGATFRLDGGSKYTPDWVFWSCGVMFAIEVKGPYRFPSEGRALVAFLEARAKFKRVKFVWVQKQKDGKWVEKHVDERT